MGEIFSATYPDGMKRTSFMARLQNGRFKYHDDLEGLCSICNDYAYQPFEDLIKLVSNNNMNKKMKVNSNYLYIFYFKTVSSNNFFIQ